MDESEIYTRLTTILRDILDDENLVVTPDLTAAQVSAWDSFSHINIVVAAEHEFHIKFKGAEIEELKNVGEFVSLIAQKTAK